MASEKVEDKPNTGAEDTIAPEGEKKDEKKNFLGIPTIPAPKMPTMDFMKKKPEPEAPNLLWKHIGAKDWEAMNEDLEGDDINDMAKTWYKENLPLHAVCKAGKVPDEIVLKILDACPAAAEERGKNRMLPLQLAVYSKYSYNVIRKLILAYPSGLDARIDDKNPIRVETTRTWIDFQGHPQDVKKLIQRSSADWKVIKQYEDEQHDQHERLVVMEKRLRTAKKKHDKADEVSKSLAERLGELEAAHSRISISIGNEIAEHESLVKGRVAEIKEKLRAFMQLQEAKNQELLNDLATAKHREVVTTAVMKLKKDELIRRQEELRKELSKLKRDVKA